MGYYDGNTVTAMWNYAQHFAMSDNSYDTNFGPSTPGAVNLVSGQTNGVIQNLNGTGGRRSATATAADPDQRRRSGRRYVLDHDRRGTVQMGGKNIGDLLNPPA